MCLYGHYNIIIDQTIILVQVINITHFLNLITNYLIFTTKLTFLRNIQNYKKITIFKYGCSTTKQA